jgi:hypothetical protein
MITSEPLPTPPELDQAPELALISVLEITLEMTVRALVAAHPQLCDHDRPYWIPQTPSSTIAETIVSKVDSLKQSLHHYRHHINMEMNPCTPEGEGAQF